MKYKYYIIGSGIVGSVIAHELAVKGAKIQIYERRDHIGGNLYDYIDSYGVHVQKYGPHIFHTKRKEIFEYVSKFCEWKEYNLVCGSVIDGKCVPTAFDFTSIDMFFPDESKEIKEHIQMVYGEQKSATILEMLDCKDFYIQKFAQYLYEKDYKPYTAKQWGISPDEIDKQIFKRVPILFSYGSKYFDDTYQVMPVNGYMELIENLLAHKHISVKTGEDALNHIKIQNNRVFIDGKNADGTVIYTGPIDELFDCKYGRLPYRSLRFEWKHEEKDSYQDMPVVAYPQVKDYTRITEYKKLPYQNIKGTTYAVEYPIPYKKGEKNEPYYPVLTSESSTLFDSYKELADKTNGLICCGRLADFKYYNMDEAVGRALEIVSQIEQKGL